VPSRIVDSYIEKTIIEAPEGKIPLTPEEKKDELTKAMEKWIAGMMEACKSDDGTVLVKAWDVVNEAVSGADSDGDGIYDLQHESDNKNDFFWQNYLGDEDYVRTAVRLARQYGGNDLKLFVNDYNLESDWDQNKKLKSLIEWIKIWESDGTTKIDGIGSQMHISCYADPNTQESKKNAIAESFKLMAATGKLVRISELDMGYVGTDGKAVKTADMTEEQHKQMAELYTWVIKQYLTTIPQAQQWGICQWCATDAPASSGWRGGEPVGLWDVNYYRKHTYASFADGLGNK
jgi:GH35 family endo-1,4-beta-xylanase